MFRLVSCLILLLLLVYTCFFLNNINENFINKSGNVLLVSGYWDVKNKHGNKFNNWFNNTLNVDENYILYSDRTHLDVFKKIREKIVPNKTIYIEKDIDSFYTSKLHINNKVHHIHVPSKQLGLIWLEKIQILFETSLKYDYEWYAWIDAGISSLRKRTDITPIKIFTDEKIKLLKKDKINYCSSDNSKITSNWEEYKHDVAGGFNIIHKTKVKFFRDLFYSYLDECIKSTDSFVCYSDQVILSKMKLNNKEHFNKLCDGYGCFVNYK